ncbi:hypothetical protein ElyMa_000890100 [Elysia marginata]|uniref:Uncharacterized protein n=1 Tax=Elysia marginata TaxID=1093978 RepID=A0AAV4H6Z3_9GAST|nr:hypothetical protein ElyMa_000890100 [Elysia marginata]
MKRGRHHDIHTHSQKEQGRNQLTPDNDDDDDGDDDGDDGGGDCGGGCCSGCGGSDDEDDKDNIDGLSSKKFE